MDCWPILFFSHSHCPFVFQTYLIYPVIFIRKKKTTFTQKNLTMAQKKKLLKKFFIFINKIANVATTALNPKNPIKFFQRNGMYKTVGFYEYPFSKTQFEKVFQGVTRRDGRVDGDCNGSNEQSSKMVLYYFIITSFWLFTR